MIKLVSFVKILKVVADMITMNTHLKCILGFTGCLWYRPFVDFWDLTRCAERVRTYPDLNVLPKYAVYLSRSDLKYLCIILRYNNSREIFLLGISFSFFHVSFIFTKNACFLCALCGNITVLCSLAPKETVKNF